MKIAWNMGEFNAKGSGDEENLGNLSACNRHADISGYCYSCVFFQPIPEDLGNDNAPSIRFPPHGLWYARVKKDKTVIA